MARRRMRNRSIRTLFGLLVIVGVVSAAAWYRSGVAAPGSDKVPVSLTSERGSATSRPALKRIAAPPGDGRPSPVSHSVPRIEPRPAVTQVLPTQRDQRKSNIPRALPGNGRSVSPETRPAEIPPTTVRPALAERDFQAGMASLQNNDRLGARAHLNRALHAGVSVQQASRARAALSRLADQMTFSKHLVDGDSLVSHYVIRSGETLAKIANRFHVTEDLLAQINRIGNKNFIRAGRRIKVIQGPFHACIDKTQHLMNVYLQDTYVRTLRVALGSNNGTPTGKWKVENHQENPSWTDPRNGQRWHPDDPDNPIGEYWIGLEGLEGDAVGQFGYGIHGTIEMDTIGQDVSLGCIRLGAEDIALAYKLLVPGISYVTIED